MMKPILKTLLISATCFILGCVVMFLATKNSSFLQSKVGVLPTNREVIYDDLLRKQIAVNNHFENLFDDYLMAKNDLFDSWFSDKFGGGVIDDISKREDDNFVYYDIKVENLNSTSINTKVENGYITITGSLEKQSSDSNNDESARSVFKSTFNRTFPLPDHVDQNKMEMLSEKDRVVLKFPKMHS